jgi:hypothetical protein
MLPFPPVLLTVVKLELLMFTVPVDADPSLLYINEPLPVKLTFDTLTKSSNNPLFPLPIEIIPTLLLSSWNVDSDISTNEPELIDTNTLVL